MMGRLARKILFFSTAACLAFSAQAQTIAVPSVPAGHPRLYLTADDLPELRRKTQDPDFVQEWANVKFGQIDPVANALHFLIEPGAIDKATGLDKCRLAIKQSLEALIKAPADATNLQFLFLREFHKAAIVYDWCYGELTQDEKSSYIAQFKRLSAKSPDSPGAPAPLDSPSLVGHQAHAPLLGNQLAAGLAIYDEDPTMFDAAAKVVLTKYKKASDFLFPGIADLSGIYYARHDHFITASWLLRRLGIAHPFNRQLAKMPYEWIYALRSDGRMLRSGDVVDDENRARMYRYVFSAVGAYYNDPLLVWMGESDNRDRPVAQWRSAPTNQFNPLLPDTYALRLIFMPRGLRERALKEGPQLLQSLPLTLYAPTPAGRMIFRTGWSSITDGMSSKDAVFDMKIGEYFIGNHQRKDFGSFQIYYRGPLAITDGVYQGSPNSWYGSEHWINYYHQTVSSNGLLIFDPNEKPFLYGVRANDGGQLWPNKGLDHPKDVETVLDPKNGYKMGAVTAHAAASDGRYAYIAGDITKAYSNKTDKVQRAMVALRTENETYPAILIVADHLRAANAQFEKRFLLHSVDAPVIDDHTVTIVNTRQTYRGSHPPRMGKLAGQYAGKLVLQNLLPANAAIRTVQGHVIEGVSYQASKPVANGEEGWGRTEIYASGQKETDFLNVMTVMDATTPSAPAADKIENERVIGCQVLDQVVLFGKNGVPLRAGTRFSIADKGPAYKVLIADIPAGRWQLIKDRRPVAQATATGEGKILSFDNIQPGDYTLEPAT